MTLARVYSRVAALERTVARPATGPCPGCGSPRPGRNALVCLTATGAPRWGACGGCGLALDERGRAMCAVPVPRGMSPDPIEVFGPDRWWMYDAV